jgi:glycine hydroxymethyltransferase
VLARTSPALTASGKTGKAKYILDDGVKAEAQQRVQALLRRYPLYPELDLDLLLSTLNE